MAAINVANSPMRIRQITRRSFVCLAAAVVIVLILEEPFVFTNYILNILIKYFINIHKLSSNKNKNCKQYFVSVNSGVYVG